MFIINMEKYDLSPSQKEIMSEALTDAYEQGRRDERERAEETEQRRYWRIRLNHEARLFEVKHGSAEIIVSVDLADLLTDDDGESGITFRLKVVDDSGMWYAIKEAKA